MKFLFIVAALFAIGAHINAQVTAQDGKKYKTIKIGNEVWMAENLDVSTYRNGDTIPQVQDPKTWSNLKTGAWCYYEGKEKLGEKYGKLYNWYAVTDPRGLAPEGWHVSTDEEWENLVKYIGGSLNTASKIKSTKGWAKDGNGINATGFAALPGGTCSLDLFSFEGNYGYWWTTTEFDSYSAWDRFLGFNNNNIGRSVGWKQFGNSVRCVKDRNEKGESSESRQEIIKNEKNSVEQKNFAVVTILNQVWMAENLNVSTFRNGDTIHQAKTNTEWENAGKLKEPAWCYYNNDPTNAGKYGKIYNWYAITDKRGLAPDGWHVPTQADWNKLISNLGGKAFAGEKIKFAEDKKNNTNNTGFNGLLSGFRTADGRFINEGIGGYWWSATESLPMNAWCYRIMSFSNVLESDWQGGKQMGFSVRCIKD